MSPGALEVMLAYINLLHSSSAGLSSSGGCGRRSRRSSNSRSSAVGIQKGGHLAAQGGFRPQGHLFGAALAASEA